MFGTVGNLAGQNALRNPRRTTATASALMIGLALACTMAIIGDSAKASVDQTVEENFVGDYVVSSVFGQPFSPQIADEDGRGRTASSEVVRQRFAFVEADGDRSSASPASIPPTAGRLRAPKLHLRHARPSTDGTVLVDDDVRRRRRTSRVGDTRHASASSRSATRAFRVGGVYEDNPLVFDFVTSTRNLTQARASPTATTS